MKPLLILAVIVLELSVFRCWSQTLASRIAPEPNWILPARSPEEPGRVTTNGTGVVYLHLDLQIDLASKSIYRRHHKRVTSEAGVQDESQLEFTYEPSHESLQIHKIEIRRNGQSLNRLKPESLRTIQREKDSYRHIYNGEEAVVAILEDVRVGDEIIFSYTVHGFNPIFGDHWAGYAPINFSVPVEQSRIRVLSPKERKPLRFRVYGHDLQPTVREGPEGREYLWLFNDLQVVDRDDRLPTWYEPYAWIHFSEYENWGAVRKWARELYRTPSAIPAEVKEIADRLIKEHVSAEARALGALKFLQDEIRYLGIEIGPNSHQPREAQTVLAKRFGDCKDKTVLLCTLLQALGIKADAALVSTYLGEKLDEKLPSPLNFNHVIVRAEIEGREYWLDPTLRYQRGGLKDVTVDSYSRALVVDDDGENLTIIPRKPLAGPTKVITESLVMRDYEGPGELKVETVYTGVDADAMRESTAAYSVADLQKTYLNYYLKRFSSVSNSAPLQILDDTVANKVTTVEKYHLKRPWPSYEEKEASFYTTFEGATITEVATHPRTYERKMPVGVRFPLHVRHVISVDLPSEGAFENDRKTIKDDAQKFDFEVKQAGKNLTFTFDYQTRADSVPVEKVSSYIKTLDEIHDACRYTATFPKASSQQFMERINWPILGLAVTYLAILAFASYKYYTWQRPAPNTPPLLANASLQGIRGWLILVAIGLVLSPFRIGATVIESLSTFSPATWNYLTSRNGGGYHPLYAPLLLGELLANLTLLGMALLLNLIFFQKKATFRHLYIAFLVFSAVVQVVDITATSFIPAVAKAITAREYGGMVGAIIGGCIWSSYALVSKRVQATFVR